MLAALTGSGVAAAAGLNAFLPMVVVGILVRFTPLLDMPAGFTWIGSWPFIIMSLVFLINELVLDKIPGVDTIYDLMMTPVRPAVGGLLFAACAAGDVVVFSQFWRDHMWLGVVLGTLIAAAVHFSKAAARTSISAWTEGVATPLASFVEDALCITLVVSAMLIPALLPALLLAMAIAIYRIVTIGRRRRRSKIERQRRWVRERARRA